MTMQKSNFFKKSSLPLLIIVVVLIAGGILVGTFLQRGIVSMAVRKDQPMGMLIIFEQEKKPVSNQLLIWYPSKSKAAIMDIPGSMGIILKSADMMSSIDTVYDARNPAKFVKEISEYLNFPIAGWLVFNEKSLSTTVDLLGGIPLFIPEPVMHDETMQGVALPGGAVTLDGDKINQYLQYALSTDIFSEGIARKQKLLIALLGKLRQEYPMIERSKNTGRIASLPRSNFNNATRKEIVKSLAQIDTDMMMTQFISGSFRTFEGRKLLFPYYDGALARDVVNQTAKALITEEGNSLQKASVTIEILNGSGEKGLANTASTLFESYGYRVVSVGNAPSFDYERTIMYDNDGNKTVFQQVSNVIECKNFEESQSLPGLRKANITIILGKDFNGRYCVGK